MEQKENIEKINIPLKTYQNFFNPILDLTLAPPYPTQNAKQKDFNRPRPMRQYRRFLPTKKALSGMDAHGTLTEFIKKDIVTPLHRKSLYKTFFDIKSPSYKHNDLIKTKMNENSKWALNTIARAPTYEKLAKVQPFKTYYFPPKYNNKDPIKYRAFSLITDHIGIKIPKLKKIEKKNSFLKLKEDYCVSTETNIQNWWRPFPIKNFCKNTSSKEYNIINFKPILDKNSNFELMNKTSNYRKKGNGEYFDLTRTFRVNVNKDFKEKFEQNPDRFRRFTGIFSNMYDAAHKNGNIIKPFGHKSGGNGLNNIK